VHDTFGQSRGLPLLAVGKDCGSTVALEASPPALTRRSLTTCEITPIPAVLNEHAQGCERRPLLVGINGAVVVKKERVLKRFLSSWSFVRIQVKDLLDEIHEEGVIRADSVSQLGPLRI